MTRRNYKQLIPTLLLTAVVWGIGIQATHASIVGQFVQTMVLGQILDWIASISLLIFTMSGWFLAACGTLFNVSMQITTHLGPFIKGTPAIYTAWSVIRDLSSLVLIFFILWAAIQMILNLKQAQYAQLLKSVIIAGVLINFSFFMAQFLIDASNIVSLQFFNAIAPDQQVTYKADDKVDAIITKAVKDGSGGIAGVFASALKVTDWWSNKEVITKAKGTEQMVGIIIATYAGSVVQLLAALSFVAAASAALMRTVVLIFMLSFSCLWIAAWAVPQMEKYTSKWVNLFKSHLLFLPIYLALMYVSVLLIQKLNLSNLVQGMGTNAQASTTQFVGLFVAFAIVMIFINVPLFGAIQAAGAVTGLTKKISDWSNDFTRRSTIGLAEKAGNKVVTSFQNAGDAAKGAAGYAVRQTIGKKAAELDKKWGNTAWGNSLLGRDLRARTVGSVAKNKFGTSRSYVDYKNEMKDVNKKAKVISRRADFEEALHNAQNGIPPVAGKSLEDIMSKMNSEEKLNLGPDILKDHYVLEYMKDRDFEALKKSDYSDEDQNAILDERKKALIAAISAGNHTRIKNMVKGYSGTELLGVGAPALTNLNMARHFTISQLQAIGDNTTDNTLKSRIAANIIFTASTGTSTPTHGWIIDQQNRGMWV